jgi:hypothetical protein
MKHITVDRENDQVKEFLRTLPLEPDGVELELNGRVICKIVAPGQLTSQERDAILEAGWQRVREAQERNRGVPAKVIEREVNEAVDEVRRRSNP